MKATLLAVLFMVSMNAMGQRPYRVSKDSVDGGLIFNGLISLDDLENEQSFIWMKTGEEEYKPDEKKLDLLKFYLRQYTIVVFMGTWCDDSHNLIPKFKKVLDRIGYPKTSITMYGVDRAKTTRGGENKKFGITNVPTFILFKDEKEAGRVTESVKTTIEGDLAAIIQADMTGQEPH